MAETTQKVAERAATPGATILDEVVFETRMSPEEEGYAIMRRGVGTLVREVSRRGERPERVDRKLVDRLIAEIDRRISRQVDAILHDPAFQRIEAAWRGLAFLVDRTDFRENIRIHLLQASREELLEDFEDASDVTTSGLYRHVYTAEYGQFGGKPIGAIVANYAFGPGARDLTLLKRLASVAAMAHAPVLTAASPAFLGEGLEDFRELPYLKDIDALFEGPRYAKWRSFRETEDARYVGLTLPRFLLRAPYRAGEGVKSFVYEERVAGDHNGYLWGNTAFALASRIADSFARYRWCPNIIGPTSGGTVADLPLHMFTSMGDLQVKIPTEVLISERREYELSEAGFIALTMRKDSDNACFFSASSAQAPKRFPNTPEGKLAETNWRLGLQLPYLFIVSRLAHYIKVIQRENLGSWKSREELQEELNRWIGQYVVDMDSPGPNVRARRPLREARITVEDVPGNPGWYKVDLKIVPHLKYMGGFFTLSLVGKLDKA